MTVADTIEKLESEKNNTRFSALVKICREYFGSERVKGSHHFFKTPWAGDPRLNLQEDKGKAVSNKAGHNGVEKIGRNEAREAEEVKREYVES